MQIKIDLYNKLRTHEARVISENIFRYFEIRDIITTFYKF